MKHDAENYNTRTNHLHNRYAAGAYTSVQIHVAEKIVPIIDYVLQLFTRLNPIFTES